MAMGYGIYSAYILGIKRARQSSATGQINYKNYTTTKSATARCHRPQEFCELVISGDLLLSAIFLTLTD